MHATQVLLFDAAGSTYLCVLNQDSQQTAQEFFRCSSEAAWGKVDRADKAKAAVYQDAGVPKTIPWTGRTIVVYTQGKLDAGKGPDKGTRKYYQWCSVCCHAGCGNKLEGCTKAKCWVAPRKWKKHLESQAHVSAFGINNRLAQQQNQAGSLSQSREQGRAHKAQFPDSSVLSQGRMDAQTSSLGYYAAAPGLSYMSSSGGAGTPGVHMGGFEGSVGAGRVGVCNGLGGHKGTIAHAPGGILPSTVAATNMQPSWPLNQAWQLQQQQIQQQQMYMGPGGGGGGGGSSSSSSSVGLGGGGGFMTSGLDVGTQQHHLASMPGLVGQGLADVRGFRSEFGHFPVRQATGLGQWERTANTGEDAMAYGRGSTLGLQQQQQQQQQQQHANPGAGAHETLEAGGPGEAGANAGSRGAGTAQGEASGSGGEENFSTSLWQVRQENLSLRAKVENLRSTLKKIVEGGGGTGSEKTAERGGSHLMQVLEGLEGQTQGDGVFVGGSTFQELEQPFLNPAAALPLAENQSLANDSPHRGHTSSNPGPAGDAPAPQVTQDQAAGAAHLQRLLGGGSGAGVGVGAKRVAGGRVGTDENPMLSCGQSARMATEESGGGPALLQEGECKRARLAAAHQKEVMLVFDGELATCDRGVITGKLQSLKRLLMKRHNTASVAPREAGGETDDAAQLLLRIHLLCLAGSPQLLPSERIWIMLADNVELSPDSEERLRSEIVQVCAFVADVCLTASQIRFVHLAPMDGAAEGGASSGGAGQTAPRAHVVVMAFNRGGRTQAGGELAAAASEMLPSLGCQSRV